jgi:hypothetical protein
MKKSIILLFFCLFSIASFAQSNDWDFENWEDGKPTGWLSSINTSQDTVNGSEFCCRLEPLLYENVRNAELIGSFIVDFNELPNYFSFQLKAGREINYWYDMYYKFTFRVQIHYDWQGGTYCFVDCDGWIENPNNQKKWKQIVTPLSYPSTSACIPDSIPLNNAKVDISFWLNDYSNVGAWAMIDDLKLSPVNPQNMFSNLEYKDVLISGEKETIKWDGGTDSENLILSYSTNDGESFQPIGTASPGSVGQMNWNIPVGLLADKCRLKLTVESTGEDLDTSNIFYIKPYVLTRLESNGEMTEYNNLTDPWGFQNDKDDVWPDWYYNQFNYNGIDEFTGELFDHLQGDSVFFSAKSEEYPSWKNFVGAFSVESCYDDLVTALYSEKALLNWKRYKRSFSGACFGLAASNALAFESINDFVSNFPNFGTFTEPYMVSPGLGTTETVIDLFTHQCGDPTIYNRVAENGLKTPTQTVEDIKKMFRSSHTEIRTLSIYNNHGLGGHTILPYKLEQDTLNEQYYYIYVYDNSKPDSTNARIRVDVSANGGAGSWEPLYGWSGWGGGKWLFLEVPATYFYVNATLKKATRSYALLDSLIDISPNDGANIRIIDRNGGTIGFTDGQLFEEIPGAHALMLLDGSESPPYRYFLLPGEYTMDISNFENETAEGYLFTKDKLFYYERKNTTPEQTDRLLYDGSLTAINPDDEARNIKIRMILEEENEEKVFKLSPFQLEADDSVKVESTDNNHVELSNMGSTKLYGVELSHVSPSGYERFVHDSIPIKANTSHRFDINWADVGESLLTIYVDEGMNGSNEDTLRLNQHVTGIDENLNNQMLAELNLKVWPNPTTDKFNMSYYLNNSGMVSLKIFSHLGNEIFTPINSERQTLGKHIIPVDLTHLPPGIYHYQLIINDHQVNGKIIKLR